MPKLHDDIGFAPTSRFWPHLGVWSALILIGLAVGCSSGNLSAPSNSRAAATGRKPTALDRYIATPDTNYSWKLISSTKAEGCTVSVLQLNSQVWLTTNEVDRPLWQHWLTVVRPDVIQCSTGFLFIGGGSSKSGAPKKADDNVMHLALATKSVVTELRNVPNQPLTFAGEAKGMSEDELIAYTWDKFLRTGDEKWPARLPMTKAAVRAMDAITAFTSTSEGGSKAVDHFVVAGGSKRGWTTWTTGAVDNRVVAIAPIVIDMLNIVPSFIHHWEAYGFWAPAVGDYVRRGIMNWTGTKEYEALMKIEEPYQYRDRLTMPKFIVNACGDQFFLPDSSHFYFKDLSGVKYLRYVPNADHSLRGSDAWESVVAYHDAILKQARLPQFSWSQQPDGSIKVETKDRPSEVKLWQATNPKARDFRLEAIGKVWTSTSLTDQGGGVYVGSAAKPAEGWTAYVVELTFPSTCEHPFKFTTDVSVTPNTTIHQYIQPKHP